MTTNRPDTVTVEVIRNLLMSIAEETYGIIVRSAYSTNMKERRDVCTAVISPEGKSVAQMESLTALLGSMMSVVPNVYEKFGDNISDGDMFIVNDAYHGGGNHLPDISLIAPAFGNGKIIGWIANIAHHADIGGKVPGSSSGDATSIFQEGIRIPLIKICERGKMIPSVMDLLLTNTRTPQERYGDLTAQISANLIGVQRLQEAYAKYNDVMVESMKEIIAYSARRIHAAVEKLPDGEYTYTDYMDSCGEKYPTPLPIKVTITIRGRDMMVDFTGSADQIEAPINVPWPCTKADVFYAIKAMLGPDIPANEGINEAISVYAPKGSILNPKDPAPMGCQIDTSQRVPDAIFGALAPLVPNRVTAAGNGACTTTLLSGKVSPELDDVFVFHEVVAGGGGASKEFDGLSGIQVNMTNTSNMPIEATEMEYRHLLIRKNELNTDSGGAGKNRGGLGIVREIEILEDNVLYTGLGDRHRFHPWGLAGGSSGEVGSFWHIKPSGEPVHLSNKTTGYRLMTGDVVRVVTPGGGGYGNAYERDCLLVLKDVIEEKVSVQNANTEYGVIISGEREAGFSVDIDATQRTRNIMRRKGHD